MPIKVNPNDDNSNAYPIDSAHPAEWARLTLQDQQLTDAMGGELAGLDPAAITDILDLACGAGGWALRTASKYPHLRIIGVDIGRHMIEGATAAALSMGLAQRTHFAVGDIVQPLPFPDASFDLVNARFISTFLTVTRWQALLAEIKRVLRPGGMVRLTEPEIGFTNAPALEHLNAVMVQAFIDQGCGSSPAGRHMGVVTMLPALVREAGFQQVQSAAHALEYSYGTPGNDPMYHNMEIGYRLMKAFFVTHSQLSEADFDRLYEQARIEMQQKEFRGMWLFLSAWGKKGED